MLLDVVATFPVLFCTQKKCHQHISRSPAIRPDQSVVEHTETGMWQLQCAHESTCLEVVQRSAISLQGVPPRRCAIVDLESKQRHTACLVGICVLCSSHDSTAATYHGLHGWRCNRVAGIESSIPSDPRDIHLRDIAYTKTKEVGQVGIFMTAAGRWTLQEQARDRL